MHLGHMARIRQAVDGLQDGLSCKTRRMDAQEGSAFDADNSRLLAAVG